MDRLALIGTVILSALLTGKAARWLSIPKVTGYLMAGLALGPTGLGIISQQDTTEMNLLSRLAIALILFDIGGEFDLATLRRHGTRGFKVALIEGGSTLLIVFCLLCAVGAPFPIALLLASIAVETSPSATILVVKELQARGHFTSTLLVVVAADVLISIASFHIFLAALGYTSLISTIKVLGGGMILGVLSGGILGRTGRRLDKDSELLLLAFGLLLVLQGVARTYGLSSMVATMVSGTTAASFPEVRERIFHSLKPIAGVLYAVLFVIAGASLHLDMVSGMGWLGAAYVIGRTAGKLLGGVIGVHVGARPLSSRHVLPLGLVPHAGVALGLTMNLATVQPDLAPTVTVVVLSAIVLFEMVGPIGVSACLKMAGEAKQPTDALELDVLDDNGQANVGSRGDGS